MKNIKSKNIFSGESVCFSALFVCNYLGITGVRNKVNMSYLKYIYKQYWVYLTYLSVCNIQLMEIIVDSLFTDCQAPYLLVPWLAVYMVGIISCYIAAFMYFLTVYYEDRVSVDPIVPVLTGLVFHLVWYFIKNIFNNLRKDLRYRCVPPNVSCRRYI